MSDINNFIGERIRSIRKIRGLSQEELAFRANINPAHLGQIERALKSPTLETLEKISNALEISISELFDYYPSNEIDDDSVSRQINNLLNNMDLQKKELFLKWMSLFNEWEG